MCVGHSTIHSSWNKGFSCRDVLYMYWMFVHQFVQYTVTGACHQTMMLSSECVQTVIVNTCSSHFVVFNCPRLRDLSAQDKLEHQRVVKDLEKNAAELNQLKEDRDKLAKELQVS